VSTLQDDRLSDDTLVAERIVRGAIDALRSHPFNRVDHAVVAATAGVDEAEVTRLFPTWKSLLLVTYDRWIEIRGTGRHGQRPASTVDYVRMTLVEDVHDPGLVRVMAGAINIASAGDDAFSDMFRRRHTDFHAYMTVALAKDFEAGREVSAIPASEAATQLLAMYEGLQIQMLVRRDVDIVAEFDSAAETLRRGWRRGSGGAWDLGDA
jgi:hypothetical protein